MKRLFVAVDVDENAREEIGGISAAAQQALSRFGPRARVTWVRADRLHVTLEFFWEADEAAEQRVRSSLAEPFPIPSFNVRFDGLGFFPPGGPPRVLWLGIADGLEDLRAIHVELGRRLRGPGRRGDFNPHLTLARFRDRVSRSELKGIAGLRASAGPCRIDRVTLYESRLSPEGPAYTGLEQALLQPCA